MHKLKKLFPQSLKNLYHLAQAVFANVYFCFPTKKLKVIGITGTDGKTTTTQMVVKILQEAGKKVAMASTINFVINGVEEKNLSHYTTESSFAVQKFAKKAVDEGCEYLVLETSSHSLDQYRVWGVAYLTAVVTNVTREHLDYHLTMENYRNAKMKLFAKAKNAVVNMDMEKPEDFLQFESSRKVTCAVKSSAEIKAENVKLDSRGSTFTVGEEKFTLNLVGDFNIENALAAISVGICEGIDLKICASALEKIQGVPGRMENVANDRGLDIIVDFALTPDSLGRLYAFLVGVKKTSQSRIIAVFGSCGDRDRGKRPVMGKVVSQFADIVILTNDEPYHENPTGIIDEIFAGVMAGSKKEIDESKTDPNFQFPISNFQTNQNEQISNGKMERVENINVWRISDRRLAIRKALEIAKTGDMIVVTGMGNLESMVVGDKKIAWNDKQVILEELAKI